MASFFFLFRQQIYYTNSKGSHKASRSPPRWRQSNDLEFRTTLDEDFIGFESSVEAEISVCNLPLYNLFVAKRKNKKLLFGINFSPQKEF